MAKPVSRVIRARYEGGVLRPLEPLDLEEGDELLLEVKAVPGGVRRFYGILRGGSRETGEAEEDYYDYISERSSIP